MRLIDADALEDTLGIEDRDIYVKATIREAPTIDAVPVVHGEWKLRSNARREKGYERYCSVCTHRQIGMTLYCPICGAKMDGRC